jgi:hypothetical protein
MKSGFARIFFLTALILGAFQVFADSGEAGVDLPWSTTFNCPDWNGSGGLDCSGLRAGGSWTCNGRAEQITSSANNSSAGKGQRHWKGDGTNLNSGGLEINFNTPQGEIWVRWYMRYEAGFKWSSLSYDKIIYLDNTTVPEFYEWDRLNVYAGGVNNASVTGGWDTVMKNGQIDPATGHRTSDGRWHCYEVHLKNNGSNGVAEFWVDGVRRLSASNVNFGTNFTRILFGSNQKSPGNGGCGCVDYDDIAVSNRGYIGPLSNTGSSVKKPSAPAFLR